TLHRAEIEITGIIILHDKTPLLVDTTTIVTSQRGYGIKRHDPNTPGIKNARERYSQAFESSESGLADRFSQLQFGYDLVLRLVAGDTAYCFAILEQNQGRDAHDAIIEHDFLMRISI